MLKNRLECNEIQDNEIEGKMPSIIKLASTAALNVAENKIPNVSGIAKKNFGAKKKDIDINISPHLIIINSQTIYLMQR